MIYVGCFSAQKANKVDRALKGIHHHDPYAFMYVSVTIHGFTWQGYIKADL